MDPEDAGLDSLTRRGFGSFVAAAAGLSLADNAGARESKKTLALQESLLAILRARYGKHLTAEQLEALGRSLKRGLARAHEMRRVPLTNADEPAIVFRADLP